MRAGAGVLKMKYFLDGIAILIPFILSVLIVVWLVDFFTYPLHLWLSHVVHHRIIIKTLAFVFTVIFITTLGFLIQRWALHRYLDRLHSLFLKVPIFKTIYKSCYQAIHVLFKKKGRAFSAVVTFEYGNTNGQVVGLIPREENLFENHVPIMHTGPSPLHNLILFVDKDKLHATDIPIENAIRWSVSAGSAPLNNS